MNRKDMNDYILQTYSVEPEFPWIKYPQHAIYRHGSNRKWFAVMMDIPGTKLGMESSDLICVLNLKCDPMLIGSLNAQPGIYPGYHMNKAYWITVCLNGNVPDDMIKWLLNMSFDLTNRKK